MYVFARNTASCALRAAGRTEQREGGMAETHTNTSLLLESGRATIYPPRRRRRRPRPSSFLGFSSKTLLLPAFLASASPSLFFSAVAAAQKRVLRT